MTDLKAADGTFRQARRYHLRGMPVRSASHPKRSEPGNNGSRPPFASNEIILDGMTDRRYPKLVAVLVLMLWLLGAKTLLAILFSYRDYFPPDMTSDFLRGREQAFRGIYRVAFYLHILSGPVALLLGSFLIHRRSRLRFPRLHPALGRVQVAVVLLGVTPSGLWMAGYAESGMIAGWGFGLLAVATGGCAALGWKAAIARDFDAHRRWMPRCFVLLCSAIILRLIGGLGTLIGVESPWAYPLAAWASWLIPLAGWELIAPQVGGIHQRDCLNDRPPKSPASHPIGDHSIASPAAIVIIDRRVDLGVESGRN